MPFPSSNNSVSTWGYPLYVAASEIRDRPVVKANVSNTWVYLNFC